MESGTPNQNHYILEEERKEKIPITGQENAPTCLPDLN